MDIGDLELATTRRGEMFDHVEGVRAQEVDADRDQVALGDGRLLLEADHLALGIELGHPEPLRIGYAVQERAGPVRTGVELRRHVREITAAQDVVAEDAAERIVADEGAGEPDRVGDAQGAALVAIGQLQPEVPPVAQQLDDVTDALAADDDHHLADAHPASVAIGVDRRRRRRPGCLLVTMVSGRAAWRSRRRDDALHRPRATRSWSSALIAGQRTSRWPRLGLRCRRRRRGRRVARLLADRQGLAAAAVDRLLLDRRQAALVVEDHQHVLERVEVGGRLQEGGLDDVVRVAPDVDHLADEQALGIRRADAARERDAGCHDLSLRPTCALESIWFITSTPPS